MPHVRGDCNRDSPHASPVSGRVCHRAGSGPDGAGPAPGLEKFRFFCRSVSYYYYYYYYNDYNCSGGPGGCPSESCV